LKLKTTIFLLLLSGFIWASNIVQGSELDVVAEGSQAPEDVLVAPYQLRVIYLVPSNRAPQPNAEPILKDYVRSLSNWLSRELESLGYSDRALRYELDSDGISPKINTVVSSQPDFAFHDPVYVSRWSKILSGITELGFPPWQTGELLLVVAETHVQNSDGSLDQATVFFGGAGTQHAGIGMVTGETLARFASSSLLDGRLYDGVIWPNVGPYPMVFGSTFPPFAGFTISSVSSGGQGGTLHELGHGLGLFHDQRNDRNFNGNLMGNGFRGWRGAMFPNFFPNDDVRLASGSARKLAKSRFLRDDGPYSDNTLPQINIIATGTGNVEAGHLVVSFEATDSESGLAGAILIRDAGSVADIPLSGTSSVTTMRTPMFTPGSTQNWRIYAFDQDGNGAFSPIVEISVPSIARRAPIPHVEIHPRYPRVGEALSLDASRSLDPDGDIENLLVEWDFDGDGIFDTLPSDSLTYEHVYEAIGDYQVTARLTGILGTSSISMPIGIQILPNAAPDCAAAEPSMKLVRPPNHRFVEVAVNVSDPDGDEVNVEIDSVFQDEPISGSRTGVFSPDAMRGDPGIARIRAERLGFGNGRVYHVYFSATDSYGATCAGKVLVGVPHDAKRSTAVDDGPLFDSGLDL
jgi:hypothetical protein